MPLTDFQEKIAHYSGRKLKFKINDNRSTMLSVRWEPDCTRVSLHRIFLKAPQNVMEELSCYLAERPSQLPKSVKAFIEKSLKTLDYTHELDQSKLYSQGNVYNLKRLYESVNSEYFDGKLSLNITWFGKPAQRNRSRITFGLYQDSLKLIKINRLLDSPSFPDYFLEYVIYHEMLHHVCPSYIDERGIHRIHSKEFKQQEVLFRHYSLAQRFIRERQEHLFAKCH
jgi:hypothetical protein